ncbi:hypothetical protein HPB52_014753 [Rhipicephalus sanguineus]|uniref:Uncharacterized protein n=1 Tax=Rhipicephalus sanguineus TaxID=34632 RepID=A0A9D4QB90_RHISA|nr:hypothetical protein HPB52_014753 [Rhipicephalus sanguineus]
MQKGRVSNESVSYHPQVPLRQPFVFSQHSKFAPPPPPPSFQFVFPPGPPRAEVHPRLPQFLSPDKLLQGGQPVTGGTFDQLLRIAQSPAVSNIISNNPDLVVKVLRGIAGAKPLPTPIGTAHSTAGLTGSKIGGADIEALLNFVRQDPNLVRNIVRADPEFVPSLVNNILGIPGQGVREPTPAPPANFSGFDFKQPNNDTEGDKSSDDVPANVPVETTQDKGLVLPPDAPKTAAKPPANFRTHYSFQAYPSNFYTLPNYGPSPYNTYGFPAGFGGPQQPERFFSSPWRPATPLRVLNVPKFTDYINQATELTYGNKNRLNKQQTTEVQVPGSVLKDKPETAPAAVVTTKQPEKLTLDAYGSVRKSTPKTSFKTNVTTERPAVLQSYGSVQKDKPKTTSTAAFTTPRLPKRPSVPAYLPVPEEQPAVQTHGPTKANKAPSRTDKLEPSYTASSTGQAGTLVKSVDVAAEKPVVEQDLPVVKGAKGDVYTSAGQDQETVGSDRPTEKKTAAPPPVRPVFVPATGKFRLGKDQKGSPEANVGSFPASLFDPTAFDGKDTKNSQTSGPAKPRARRDTSSTPAMTSLINLDKLRTMDNRKCVFKMVCFIGANDHTLGRVGVGDGISLVLRYIARSMLRYVIRYFKSMSTDGDGMAAAYNRAYEVGRTHGGEGCRIKYNTCPMTVVDLVSLSANFG